MLKRARNNIKYIFVLLCLLLFFNLSAAIECFGDEEEAVVVLKTVSFDKDTGRVSYELTMPAWVRIRAGVANGPLYRTICDWERKDAGKHDEDWDGMDPSGKFPLKGRKDLVFSFNYYTAGDEYLSNVQSSDIQQPSGNLSGRHLPNLKVNQLHKNHKHDQCYDTGLNIDLPKSVQKNKEGFYTVNKKLPIAITFDDKDKVMFLSERYSIHIFIDDVFVQGELDGYSPYTWIFDPTGLNEGEHLITINFAGYSDHYGMATLPVYVKKGRGNRHVFSKK